MGLWSDRLAPFPSLSSLISLIVFVYCFCTPKRISMQNKWKSSRVSACTIYPKSKVSCKRCRQCLEDGYKLQPISLSKMSTSYKFTKVFQNSIGFTTVSHIMQLSTSFWGTLLSLVAFSSIKSSLAQVHPKYNTCYGEEFDHDRPQRIPNKPSPKKPDLCGWSREFTYQRCKLHGAGSIRRWPSKGWISQMCRAK